MRCATMRCLCAASCALWAGVLAVVLALPAAQRVLTHLHIIPGTHTLFGGLHAPQSAWGVIGARAVYLRHPSGERIGFWHILPAGAGGVDSPGDGDERQAEYFDAALASDCVVLYLHGNAFARNQGHRLDLYRLVTGALRCHLIAPDYRGYGDSDGTPSQAAQVEDAALVWAWLTARVPAQRIILFGHSLGGAVANLLCAQLLGGGAALPRGLLLQATFASMREAALNYPLARPFTWLPGVSEAFDSLWEDKYPGAEALARTAAQGLPVLIVHGSSDEVIDTWHAHRLREVVEKAQPGAAGEASRLVIIEGGTHSDLENTHAPQLAREVLRWLRQLGLAASRASSGGDPAD